MKYNITCATNKEYKDLGDLYISEMKYKPSLSSKEHDTSIKDYFFYRYFNMDTNQIKNSQNFYKISSVFTDVGLINEIFEPVIRFFDFKTQEVENTKRDVDSPYIYNNVVYLRKQFDVITRKYIKIAR